MMQNEKCISYIKVELKDKVIRHKLHYHTKYLCKMLKVSLYQI